MYNNTGFLGNINPKCKTYSQSGFIRTPKTAQDPLLPHEVSCRSFDCYVQQPYQYYSYKWITHSTVLRSSWPRKANGYWRSPFHGGSEWSVFKFFIQNMDCAGKLKNEITFSKRSITEEFWRFMEKWSPGSRHATESNSLGTRQQRQHLREEGGGQRPHMLEVCMKQRTVWNTDKIRHNSLFLMAIPYVPFILDGTIVDALMEFSSSKCLTLK